MCGIFAAINDDCVTEHLLSGLSSLSYRGYDSAGIATVSEGHLQRRRAKGKLKQLKTLLNDHPIQGSIGIAHTRWATHGLPNESNAHPHMTSKVAVVHNGIVENYCQLRSELENGGYYMFESETDSEVITQLITYYLDSGYSNQEALSKTLARIQGSFALAIIFYDSEDVLYAARRSSPLLIGRGNNGFYVSSDVNALARDVTGIVNLKDGDIARIQHDSYEVINDSGYKAERPLQPIEHGDIVASKQGYDHYMQKEIFEQPAVFERTWSHYFDSSQKRIELPPLPFSLNAISRISIVACGTSYFAGMVGKYWLESLAGIPVDLDVASEYRYRNSPVCANSVALFISQSGETADTLSAMECAKKSGQPCLAMVNVMTSTMAREADVVLPTLAGPEIGVASTKAFISQLTSLLIFSLVAAKENQQIGHQRESELFDLIEDFPDLMQDFLRQSKTIEGVAKFLCYASNTLYLGRNMAYPLAEEGALKLKEISYIHAEAYPAGELKHGPLALVDKHMPVIIIAPPDKLFEKTLSSLREVAARGGQVILISDSKGIAQADEFLSQAIEMPSVDPLLAPLFYSLPLQLLAYYVAVEKDNDIDQPRNLAKSVTVE